MGHHKCLRCGYLTGIPSSHTTCGNHWEVCTCGSGGHPRRCDLHPGAYEEHIAELNRENATDYAAEIERLKRTPIDQLTAAECTTLVAHLEEELAAERDAVRAICEAKGHKPDWASAEYACSLCGCLCEEPK
jgi:hypothetical protein